MSSSDFQTSSSQTVFAARASKNWNRSSSRIQNTWLKFENDEPTVCTADEYRNQRGIPCDVDFEMERSFFIKSEFFLINLYSIVCREFPSIKIEEDNNVHQQPTTSAEMQRQHQNERSIGIANRLSVVDTETEFDSMECGTCGGTRIRKCSIDETPSCFGQINLFGHLRSSDILAKKILLYCQCENHLSSSTLTLAAYRSEALVRPLRRSSSAELLPLASPRRPQHVFLDI